jgi:hypothetical protein
VIGRSTAASFGLIVVSALSEAPHEMTRFAPASRPPSAAREVSYRRNCSCTGLEVKQSECRAGGTRLAQSLGAIV